MLKKRLRNSVNEKHQSRNTFSTCRNATTAQIILKDDKDDIDIDLARNGNSGCANEILGCAKCHFWWKSSWKWKNWGDFSVLPKVFWAPVLRTSGSSNLPVRKEGSLVRNFNNCYVLFIHVFDGCSNRLDPCDHFNLVCCCLSPVLISDKRSYWKISQSQTHMIRCWNARTAF